MTNEELLQDTINYYWGHPERQCKSDKGTCSYSPITANKEATSEGCAIGRLLPEELKDKFDKEFSGSSIDEMMFELLPEELKHHEFDFLEGLQRLHDDGTLLRKDKIHVKTFCRNFNLNADKITFPETNNLT